MTRLPDAPDAPASPNARPEPRPPARPATAAESGIWVNERLGGVGALHNVAFTVRFDGDLDAAALRRACDAVLRRHPVLTSVVEDRAGAPFLVPAATRPELVAEPASAEATSRHLLAPFDLAGGPLCRLVLQAAGPAAHRLLVAVHHLVFDGHSLELFMSELAACYRAEAGGGDPGLPEPSPAEPAAAEDERIAAALPAARRYWAEHPLPGDTVLLPGLDRPVTGVQDGDAVRVALPPGLRERFGPAAQRLGVTRFELLVASVHALLYRYGNAVPATALDLGTRTASQRDRIGVHVNELPFCSAPRGRTPFAAFAGEVRAGLRELYRVRQVPLARVGAGLRPGVALAPVSLTYLRRSAAREFPGVTASAAEVLFNHTARNALRIQVFEEPGGELRAVLQYPPAALAGADVERTGRHWLTLLGHVTSGEAAAQTPLAELPLLDRDERDTLLTSWNRTAVAYPARTVPELVAEHAASRPDATAVVHAGRRLTYAELNAAAGRVAEWLRCRGIGPGSIVAIRANRSERLVIGLLGALRAGAAYLPLDPGYPPRRIELIAADSRFAAELGEHELSEAIGAEATTAGAGHAGAGHAGWVTAGGGPAPADLAYVSYTSGSTGRPKGVQIEHRALTNLLLSMRDLLDAQPAHTWLAHTSVSFDISALEIFLPLITGGTTVIAGEAQTRDGAALRDLATRHAVTHIQATPTAWTMLLDAGLHAPAVTALSGGEALPPSLAHRLRAATGRLINVYGPTETTIWSTAATIEAAAPDRIPIGRPLANTRAYVLDERLAPVPIGIPGDLYLAGAGLARGYLGRPALDAEHFLPNPFEPPGTRMYRTGDRARFRPGGQLEFLGRLDDQVKLRGHRLELGEIESALLAVPGVRRAAAAVHGGTLVGYHLGGPDPGELRRALAATLPAHAVPEILVAVDALPTTPNGKLDRSALPPPPRPAAPEPAADPGPLAAVRAIWCEVLRVPTIGDTEDLFDLGGHSVTMTQISARIRDRLGVDVPLHAYFDDPTIRGITAVVATLQPQHTQ